MSADEHHVTTGLTGFATVSRMRQDAWESFADALTKLSDALYRADITRSDDRVTVTLPYEAGRRFEMWLALNAPMTYRLSYHEMVRTIDGDEPQREFDFGGATVAWPLKRVMLHDHSVIPEPPVRLEDLMRMPTFDHRLKTGSE